MSRFRTREAPDALCAIRLPSRREARAGAEIVFIRLHRGRRETVYAAACYESWQQWGATRDVLSANVSTVERWRCGNFPDFPPPLTEEDDARALSSS